MEKLKTKSYALQSLWEKPLSFLKPREKPFMKKSLYSQAGMKPMPVVRQVLRNISDSQVSGILFC